MTSFLRAKRRKTDSDPLVELAIACEHLVQNAVELPNQNGKYISFNDWEDFLNSFIKVKNTPIN